MPTRMTVAELCLVRLGTHATGANYSRTEESCTEFVIPLRERDSLKHRMANRLHVWNHDDNVFRLYFIFHAIGMLDGVVLFSAFFIVVVAVAVLADGGNGVYHIVSCPCH